MTDDLPEEETERPASIFQVLTRKFTFIFGIFILVWLLLAKNIPSLFSPYSHSTPTPHPQYTRPPRKNTSEPAIKPAEPAANPLAIPEKTEPKAEEKPVEPEFPKTETAQPKPAEEPVAAHATAPAAIVAAPVVSEAEKARIAQLETQLTAMSKDMADMKKLLDDTIKQRAALDAKLAAQTESVSDLKSQFDELHADDARELTAITAFSILKESANRGEPFDGELKQLESTLTDGSKKALLMQLKPFASDGIPTLPTLQSQFEQTVPQALSAEHKGNTFARNLASLIRIRKEGEHQQGPDDEAILARAEAKVNHGEIALALKEMLSLSPLATDALADWIKNARIYLDGRNVLDTLQLSLVKSKAEPEKKPKAPEVKAPEKIEQPATKTEKPAEPAAPPKKEAPGSDD